MPFDSARFRVLRQLGAGGFGVVYLVRDLHSGEDVALKTLQVIRPEQTYRLKREFRSLSNLRHKNLVAFYELFVEGDQTYFTMEYVPGETFLDYVRPGLALDEERLRKGLVQLATGLSVLHQARTLHRDVKPSNVLVTPEQRVVLLDFGLATEIEASKLGESIESAGTPEYMSPEQARGEPLTAASDWYSVGIMLYQALTGRVPFSRKELMARPQRSHLPTPREVEERVSPELSALCMALLTNDVRQRGGAAELLALEGGKASLPLASTRPRSVLFGREAELEQLETCLTRVVVDREGVTVLLDGTSGVGKTSLIEHFLNRDRRETTTVLRGRCYEREQVPYQGIDSLIDDVSRLLNALDTVDAEGVLPRYVPALVRLFPGLERVPVVAARVARERFPAADEREMRRRAFAALRELLALIGDRQTLIIHIDDLQWGDLDTAGLLRDLLRPPDAPVMLLILAYRSEDQERSPCLALLAEEPIGAQARLHLGPLAPDAAAALMRELLPSTQGDLDVSQLAQEAGGNPFLLQELARFAGLQQPGERPHVQSALTSRIEQLPQTALELLQIVAVAGHPIPETVARAAAAPAGSVTEAWHLLVTEHLVRVSGPLSARLVETFHDRIRETVLASMTPPRTRACHRSLAAALELAGDADPEVLAQHHQAAQNQERALEYTVIAAKQATDALAFDRAARLLKQAVALAGHEHSQRLKLLSELGEALGNAGRCIDSAEVYLQAATAAEPEARIALRRRAASQFLLAGRIDKGRELIREDLPKQKVPVPRTPGRTVASLLWLRVRIRFRRLGIDPLRFKRRDRADIPEETLALMDHLRSVAMVLSFVDVGLGAEMGARFLLRALRLGEPNFIALGLALLAGHYGVEAPSASRTKYFFKQMDRHGKDLANPAVQGTLEAGRGLHQHFAGAWRTSIQHLDTAEGILRDCQGVICELWSTRALGIWSRFFLGEWEELRERVLVGLRDARDRGNAYGMAGICAPFGVVAWLSRDKPDEARQVLVEVTSTWSVEGFQIQHYWFLMAESLVKLYAGDGLGAWNQIRARWKSAAASLTLRFPTNKAQLLHMRGCCALAAAEQSGNATSRGLVGEAERAAERLRRVSVMPYAQPFADLLWAGIAAQRGLNDDAARRLEDAIQGLEQQEMAAYAAAARRRLAQLRGESVPKFLPRQDIANVEAVTRMLVPGFPNA